MKLGVNVTRWHRSRLYKVKRF